jgi:arylsulfatase A-like enzyme
MTMSSIRTAIIAGLMLAGACLAAAKEPRWNIITLLADDQAEWAVGAYGNSEVRTPHIDRLAAQGVRFANAFATSPVCTPSRLSFLTGLESVQVGTMNDPTSGAPRTPLPYGVPSWPTVLEKTGYRTAFIGKWDLGNAPEHSPLHYGFDYFFGFRAGSNYSKDPYLARGDGLHSRHEGYTDDILTDDAIAYLEKHGDRPFALLINYRAPHLPYHPMPPADGDAVAGVDPVAPNQLDSGIPGVAALYDQHLVKERRDYYANAHTVDRNVGRLLEALERLDLAANTIIVFTSDNGYLLGERGLFNKGPAAPIQYSMFPDNRLLWAINLWDLSIRVPMIVRWPGVADAGTVLPHFVTITDIYDTVLGMLEIPNDRAGLGAGRDFSPLLRGEDIAWRDAVFGQYTSDRIGNTEFIRMVRTNRWKLVVSALNPSANRLYDLENDPHEIENLYSFGTRRVFHDDGTMEIVAAEDPRAELRRELAARLRAWQESIDDPALVLEQAYRDHGDRALERWKEDG